MYTVIGILKTGRAISLKTFDTESEAWDYLDRYYEKNNGNIVGVHIEYKEIA